jgi:hypothetical protein
MTNVDQFGWIYKTAYIASQMTPYVATISKSHDWLFAGGQRIGDDVTEAVRERQRCPSPAMKAYRVSRGTASLTLNLSARQR